jgi:Tfp pilus assembly protein PilX
MHYKRFHLISLRRALSSERGFALVTAILACVILFALAMLVIHLSTQDLRLSGKSVGNKKALSAAETGIHDLVRNFNASNPGSSVVTNYAYDTVNAAGSVYSIGTFSVPPQGAFRSMPGFEITGGKEWKQKVWDVTVTGRHTGYDTTVSIATGIGYGPVEASPGYK